MKKAYARSDDRKRGICGLGFTLSHSCDNSLFDKNVARIERSDVRSILRSPRSKSGTWGTQFMPSHPCDKNKNVARMGHPLLFCCQPQESWKLEASG